MDDRKWARLIDSWAKLGERDGKTVEPNKSDREIKQWIVVHSRKSRGDLQKLSKADLERTLHNLVYDTYMVDVHDNIEGDAEDAVEEFVNHYAQELRYDKKEQEGLVGDLIDTYYDAWREVVLKAMKKRLAKIADELKGESTMSNEKEIKEQIQPTIGRVMAEELEDINRAVTTEAEKYLTSCFILGRAVTEDVAATKEIMERELGLGMIVKPVMPDDTDPAPGEMKKEAEIDFVSPEEVEIVDEAAITASTMKKYKELFKKNMWTEQEILAFKKHYNNYMVGAKQGGYRAEIEYPPEFLEMMNDLVYDLDKGHREINISPEQSEKGISWLRKNIADREGKLRDTAPVRKSGFGQEEAEIINNFSRFTWVGFYEESDGFSDPIYRTYDKKNNYFDYVFTHVGNLDLVTPATMK